MSKDQNGAPETSIEFGNNGVRIRSSSAVVVLVIGAIAGGVAAYQWSFPRQQATATAPAVHVARPEVNQNIVVCQAPRQDTPDTRDVSNQQSVESTCHAGVLVAPSPVISQFEGPVVPSTATAMDKTEPLPQSDSPGYTSESVSNRDAVELGKSATIAVTLARTLREPAWGFEYPHYLNDLRRLTSTLSFIKENQDVVEAYRSSNPKLSEASELVARLPQYKKRLADGERRWREIKRK